MEGADTGTTSVVVEEEGASAVTLMTLLVVLVMVVVVVVVVVLAGFDSNEAAALGVSEGLTADGTPSVVIVVVGFVVVVELAAMTVLVPRSAAVNGGSFPFRIAFSKALYSLSLCSTF